MSVTCDWCGKPIYGEDDRDRWGHGLTFPTFNSLALGAAPPQSAPAPVVLSVHVHAGRCREALSQAIHAAIEDHDPADDVVLDDVEDETGDRPAETPHEREMRERLEQRRRWKATPNAEREHFLLNAIGDRELTIAELYHEHFLPEFGTVASDSTIRVLAKRLIERGELDRRNDPHRGRPRYLYFRRKALDGPIADLDRVFSEGGGD